MEKGKWYEFNNPGPQICGPTRASLRLFFIDEDTYGLKMEIGLRQGPVFFEVGDVMVEQHSLQYYEVIKKDDKNLWLKQVFAN